MLCRGMCFRHSSRLVRYIGQYRPACAGVSRQASLRQRPAVASDALTMESFEPKALRSLPSQRTSILGALNISREPLVTAR
jgi:hypothetical protein